MVEGFGGEFLDFCEQYRERSLYHTIFTKRPEDNTDSENNDEDGYFPPIDRIERFCNEHFAGRIHRGKRVEGETAIVSYHPKGMSQKI